MEKENNRKTENKVKGTLKSMVCKSQAGGMFMWAGEGQTCGRD